MFLKSANKFLSGTVRRTIGNIPYIMLKTLKEDRARMPRDVQNAQLKTEFDLTDKILLDKK